MAGTIAMAQPENHFPLLINILSALFNRTVSQNDELAATQQQLCRLPPAAEAFSGLVKPAISIRRYLEFIFLHIDCSICCYLIAYIYIDRFLHFNPSVRLDSFNVHRLLITAILTSVKFMDGRYNVNPHFANVGGISVSEMNKLEVYFLFGLRFNLTVNPITYSGYSSFLLGQMDSLNIKVPRILQICSSEEEEEEQEEEEEEEDSE